MIIFWLKNKSIEFILYHYYTRLLLSLLIDHVSEDQKIVCSREKKRPLPKPNPTTRNISVSPALSITP